MREKNILGFYKIFQISESIFQGENRRLREFGKNASPYGAGGLASRKPEKNNLTE